MTATNTMTRACWICGQPTVNFNERGEPLPCSPSCCREVYRRIAAAHRATAGFLRRKGHEVSR